MPRIIEATQPSQNGNAANGKSLVDTLKARGVKMPRPQSPEDIHARLLHVGGLFDNFQKNGNGWKACCPVHGVDSNPSLSIRTTEDGHILMYCFAGCPTRDILKVVGLCERDLMPGAKTIVAAYGYQDEKGELLYQTVRFIPKDFAQRQPKKDGSGWDWHKSKRQVLYRLPECWRLVLKSGF